MAPLTGCQASSMLCAETFWTAKCCTPIRRPEDERCLSHPPGKSEAGANWKPIGSGMGKASLPLPCGCQTALRSPSAAQVQVAPSEHSSSSKLELRCFHLNALNTFCWLRLPGAAEANI